MKNVIKIGTSILCIFLIALTVGTVVVMADVSGIRESVVEGSISEPAKWYFTIGRIEYSYGNATGSFLHFIIDENTGTVKDYTLKLTFYPIIYYGVASYMLGTELENSTNRYSNVTYKNITIFSSISVDGFEPAAPPTAFADYLVFQGKNTLMKFIDQEGGSIHYASSNKNTKMTFEVPDGFEITLFEDYGIVLPVINSSGDGTNYTKSSPGVTDSYAELSPWSNIWIKSNDTVTTINIYNGTATINGQTIEINLSAYGYLDVYTWVEYKASAEVNDFWYNDLSIQNEKRDIEDAKNNGTILAEGWCTNTPSKTQIPQLINMETGASASPSSNYYTYSDPTFSMNFTSIDKNGVEVIVESQIDKGRIIIINVDKLVLQTTSIEQLLISLDNSPINNTNTLEELMQMVENKSSQSAFYAVSGESLTTVFVYVPHFSTHTISIKTISQAIGAVSNFLAPIILSILFTVASIGGIILQKRKYQGEF